VSARILVGTCSWADKTLVASGWYPREAKSPQDRLRFYAEQFPIVEVDSSYYGIPPERNAAAWVERTPDGFVFDVKSYALFTHHPAPIRSLPKDVREALPPQFVDKRNLYYKDTPPDVREELWSRFDAALLPLDSAGKLGTVLFQFPPWFLPGHDSADYIVEAKERLGQYTMAVEFRNDRWLSEPNRERTLKLLADNAIPFVCVDEPQGFPNSVPPLTAVTAQTALVRMHGRNAETWAKKGIGAAERFDYLYSEDELEEWVPRIESLAGQAGEVHVLMNNCHSDYAVRNARQLAERLSAARPAPGKKSQQRLL
jgi:uncharacterized protein YecE (DUF72 family)